MHTSPHNAWQTRPSNRWYILKNTYFLHNLAHFCDETKTFVIRKLIIYFTSDELFFSLCRICMQSKVDIPVVLSNYIHAHIFMYTENLSPTPTSLSTIYRNSISKLYAERVDNGNSQVTDWTIIISYVSKLHMIIRQISGKKSSYKICAALEGRRLEDKTHRSISSW